MKKIVFLMLILSHSIFTMAQDSRWKLLFSNDTSKTYVDTERTQQLPYFDGHNNIVVIWLRVMPSPLPQGESGQQTDEKIAIDVIANQLEFKSIMIKNNGKVITQRQFNTFDWTDIYPETNGELMLFYCKQYLKSPGK